MSFSPVFSQSQKRGRGRPSCTHDCEGETHNLEAQTMCLGI